jgi:hypothetical protein
MFVIVNVFQPVILGAYSLTALHSNVQYLSPLNRKLNVDYELSPFAVANCNTKIASLDNTILHTTLGSYINLLIYFPTQNLSRLQCWWYWRQEIEKYNAEVAFSVLMFVHRIMEICELLQM